MDYRSIYAKLVKRGKARRTKVCGWGAWHRHHIVPKHAGGTNDSSNITKLQVKEHRLAHFLLFKIYGKYEDELAYKMLRGVIRDPWEHPEFRKRMTVVVTNNLKHVDRAKAGRLAGIAAKKIIHTTIQSPEGRVQSLAAYRQWVLDNPEAAADRAKYMHTPEAQTNMARSKSKYITVAPDGTEYQSIKDAAEATGQGNKSITNWTIRGHYGWTRRLKTS